MAGCHLTWSSLSIPSAGRTGKKKKRKGEWPKEITPHHVSSSQGGEARWAVLFAPLTLRCLLLSMCFHLDVYKCAGLRLAAFPHEMKPSVINRVTSLWCYFAQSDLDGRLLYKWKRHTCLIDKLRQAQVAGLPFQERKASRKKFYSMLSHYPKCSAFPPREVRLFLTLFC